MNDYIKEQYQNAVNTPSDINEHLPKLLEIANECETVTEFGVRTAVSSRAFLASNAKVISYDIENVPEAEQLFNISKILGKPCQYIADPVKGNTLKIDIEPTDLLFIDTNHIYNQISQELERHHSKVKKYIAFHDTHTYGFVDEVGKNIEFHNTHTHSFVENNPDGSKKGVLHAIIDFLIKHPEWKWKYHSIYNNGLTILEKKQVSNINNDTDKISVIVPTMWNYGPFIELLPKLIEKKSIGEIIIVNNNFSKTPNSKILNHPKIRMINNEKNIFVNPSWNLGVSLSKYEKICIMNDDVDFNMNIFDVINFELKSNTLILTSYNENLNNLDKQTTDIKIKNYNPSEELIEHGHLFFLNKKDYFIIPDNFKIWCGDIYELDMFKKHNYNILVVENMYMYTPKQTTTKILFGQDYSQKYIEDCNNYESYKSGNKKKILIAIPTAKYIECATFKSIYDLEIPDGYEVEFQTFYGYRVDQVRNLIANWVEHKFDYLFAVDYDIVFSSDTLAKLLNANKDIITGLYIQRIQDQHILEIWDTNGPMDIEKIDGRGIIPVHACGFGCVLVKKEVFVSIGYPQFEYHVALDHSQTFSEDHDFCRKARDKGYTIWADTSIKCDHIGNYVYTVN